jgi:hypothetical protein
VKITIELDDHQAQLLSDALPDLRRRAETNDNSGRADKREMAVVVDEIRRALREAGVACV